MTSPFTFSQTELHPILVITFDRFQMSGLKDPTHLIFILWGCLKTIFHKEKLQNLKICFIVCVEKIVDVVKAVFTEVLVISEGVCRPHKLSPHRNTLRGVDFFKQRIFFLRMETYGTPCIYVFHWWLTDYATQQLIVWTIKDFVAILMTKWTTILSFSS